MTIRLFCLDFLCFLQSVTGKRSGITVMCVKKLLPCLLHDSIVPSHIFCQSDFYIFSACCNKSMQRRGCGVATAKRSVATSRRHHASTIPQCTWAWTAYRGLHSTTGWTKSRAFNAHWPDAYNVRRQWLGTTMHTLMITVSTEIIFVTAVTWSCVPQCVGLLQQPLAGGYFRS